MITKEQLAERQEAKLRFPGARLILEEAHDEGEPWDEGSITRRDAMLRRRWAFDQNVDAVRDWYHKRLDQIGWSYLGAISFEAWPVVFDNFQLDQGPLPPAGETRPQEFQLSFLSAEEPDPPQDYWPDDGSTPALHFQTKLDRSVDEPPAVSAADRGDLARRPIPRAGRGMDGSRRIQWHPGRT